MKKNYVKPQASYESFELSASIAGGCAKPMGHSQSDCGYYVVGIPGNVFINAETYCKYEAADGDFSACYHVPTDQAKLFTS